MSYLISVDPSVNSAGLAIFVGGQLIHAQTVKVNVHGGDPADAAYYMAGKIAEAIFRKGGRYMCSAEFVFEWPQIYRAARSKGDPNDLPALAAIGCATAAIIGCDVVKSYTPKVWAGSVPKATRTKALAENSPRAKRIKSRLSSVELPEWPKGEHDAIDAIGIGLYHLGRLEPKRLYPGAAP